MLGKNSDKKCSFGTIELIVPLQKIKNNHAMQENGRV